MEAKITVYDTSALPSSSIATKSPVSRIYTLNTSLLAFPASGSAGSERL